MRCTDIGSLILVAMGGEAHQFANGLGPGSCEDTRPPGVGLRGRASCSFAALTL